MASVLTEEMQMIAEDRDYVDGVENSLESKDITEFDRRAVNEREIGYYSDLGLGLGVDATDARPWKNKKSFRVRHVTFEKVLGIRGDTLCAFNDKVESVREFQSRMDASIPTGEILSVGIDAEASRSHTIQRRSIGKKIISRTIAFKSEFKNIPQERTDSDDSDGESQLPFENRLTEFIEGRAKKRVESLCIDSLTDYCFQFVANRTITHYVHSIQLGACHYRTMTQEEYNTNFGASATIGEKGIAEIALKNTARFETRKFKSSVIRIGQFRKKDGDQDEIEGVEVEGVVGLKLQSISSLVVNSAKLREAMEKAVKNYIRQKGDCKFGPFHISCGGHLFLKVESDNQLKTTNRLDDASQFSVMRYRQGDEHFIIVYQPPVSEDGIAVPSLYLSASRQGAPLLMKDTVSNSKLALRSRRSTDEQPVNLSHWVGGSGEFFYIICKDIRRTIRWKQHYLCVFKPSSKDGLEDQEYVTGCKLREDHDLPNTHMLFSLVKLRKGKPCPDEDEGEGEGEGEGEALGDEYQSDLTPTEGSQNLMISDRSGLTPSEMPNVSEKGPFFITTDFDSGNNKTVYFKVEDCNVHATTEKSEASRFYVRYERNNPFFRVNLYHKTSPITTTGSKNNDKLEHSCFVTQFSGSNTEWCIDPILYLSAVVPRHGHSNRNHPLQLQHRDTSSSQSYGYLAICEQKSQSTNSEEVELVTPERWFQEPGNEAFYIRCSAKPDTTSANCSYLCVRRKARYCRRQTTYSTGSVTSISDHNKRGSSRSMLFKLVRASESEPRERLAESEML